MRDLYSDVEVNPLDRVSPAARQKSKTTSRFEMVEEYINHDSDTDENLAFQLGYKPSESEYFGCGFQITN